MKKLLGAIIFLMVFGMPLSYSQGILPPLPEPPTPPFHVQIELPNQTFTSSDFITKEPTLPHDPYTDDERLQLASEKKFTSEETMGGGSGMGYFDKSDFNLSAVIISIPIGVGAALVLVYYLRKGRLNRL